MRKITHLIPFDGIGGVESAANTMKNITFNDIDFNVLYVSNNHSSGNKYLNIINYFSCIHRLINIKPDLLVVSLWRSCIVAILYKLLRPRAKIVLFLHYPHHYHFVDMVFTRTMSYFCLSLWADSQDTLDSRVPSFSKDKSHVISFVARRLKPSENIHMSPNFIFWGRLHEQKCINRSINIFAAIHSVHKDATYMIIGPDGGELSSLKKLVNDIGIGESVSFLGSKNLNSIIELSNKASFYLQTSKLEGMAMSVVEAMQLGLLPIVTPVGEIKNYCSNRQNSIIIKDDADAVSCILDLIKNKNLYIDMRNNAIKKWENYEIYSESFIKASNAVLDLNS